MNDDPKTYTHLAATDFTRTLCGKPIDNRREISTVMTPTSESLALLRMRITCRTCAAVLRHEGIMRSGLTN